MAKITTDPSDGAISTTFVERDARELLGRLYGQDASWPGSISWKRSRCGERTAIC